MYGDFRACHPRRGSVRGALDRIRSRKAAASSQVAMRPAAQVLFAPAALPAGLLPGHPQPRFDVMGLGHGGGFAHRQGQRHDLRKFSQRGA